MRQSNLSLNSIFDDEFLTILAKSADLYKIGSNTVLDPEEIRIGLKVVPRAVMSMLISELSSMEINSHKDIHLPFGRSAYIGVNKNAADDYSGLVYNNNKIVYDFRNRSIPGLGIILLSTFELYELENLSQEEPKSEDVNSKIQKLIDERMELHSLVGRVVEERISQREAVHRMMMAKLNEALDSKKKEATDPLPLIPVSKPLEIKPEDIVKKEDMKKKGSPLKDFLDRKKKPKEYRVEMAKSESINCPDCNQVIFGETSAISCCICYGQDQNRKIWIKKNDNNIQIRFSKGWDPENIELLLETLRKKNGRH